jgi:hypothetical protein
VNKLYKKTLKDVVKLWNRQLSVDAEHTGLRPLHAPLGERTAETLTKGYNRALHFSPSETCTFVANFAIFTFVAIFKSQGFFFSINKFKKLSKKEIKNLNLIKYCRKWN